MPVSVVKSALLRIGQDAVGFDDLFELLLSLLITRITIRMILQGELPIRRLDLLFTRRAADAQDLVIIPLVLQD
jgi:hypothetical protein